MSSLSVMSVVGARPNFMKIAPLCREFARRGVHHVLVHTGQHYDRAMSGDFFDELGIPEPDVNLGIGSGSHAEQTANIMKSFEPVLLKHKPDWLVVVGDVNSTMACTLVAGKLGIRVAHVEAGLRSRDRSMPEEVNRLVTDVLADLLLTPSRDADENLLREGIEPDKIRFVGNVMIDTLRYCLDAAKSKKTHEKYLLKERDFALVTLHRPSNVDQKESLNLIVAVLIELSNQLPVLFPVHPRTKNRLESFGLYDKLMNNPNIHATGPVPYLDCLCLESSARLAVTDSGGMQEETSVLGTPCLTLRPNTERPVTLTEGCNKLTTPERLYSDLQSVLSKSPSEYRSKIPELWDGHTAERITDILLSNP